MLLLEQKIMKVGLR